MRRLAATIATDVRLQLRNGFYVAAAFVAAFSILLLRWLPEDAAAFVLPVVIVENVLVNTFYFVSGLLLLERIEGTFAAQSVTPLRDDEYLASKLVTLTVLSLAESLCIAAGVFWLEPSLIALAIGVALCAVLFCLVGVALVVRHDSINEFLMPSVLYTSLLTLPVLGAFGVGPSAWYLPHPVQGPLTLMQVDASHTAATVVYAVGYPLLWILAVYPCSRRALSRIRRA